MDNKSSDAKERKKEIAEKCIVAFIENGIEKTSVRDLCKAAGIHSATMYYYFESKDNVIIECIRYEIEVVNTLVMRVFDFQLPTVTDFLKTLLDEVTKGAGGIRFIAQVLASPNHFRACRDEMLKLHKRYEQYALKICQRYNISLEIFKPLFFIYLTVSYDYFIKGDEDYYKVQMDAVFMGIDKMF